MMYQLPISFPSLVLVLADCTRTVDLLLLLFVVLGVATTLWNGPKILDGNRKEIRKWIENNRNRKNIIILK